MRAMFLYIMINDLPRGESRGEGGSVCYVELILLWSKLSPL